MRTRGGGDGARRFHRILAVFGIGIGLYVGITGVVLQGIDLVTLLRHAPAGDPNLRAIRDGRDGPPNFRVSSQGNFAARPLPTGFDYDRALGVALAAARPRAEGAPIRFVEFRMAGTRPVVQVDLPQRRLRVDAATGATEMASGGLAAAGGSPSLRKTVKNIHRMLAYGDVGVAVFFVLALVMGAMAVTGLVLHARLIRARARVGRFAPFWSAGGAWRALHRGTALVASLFLLVVVGSGMLLAFGDLSVSIYGLAHHGRRPGLTVDMSAPLSDAQLTPMLHRTLAAYQSAVPDGTIRVLRLRWFAGMPQGVVVTGGEDARQFAFNTATGRPAGLSGPGYPATGQPFGWAEDQFVKRLHRGDLFGMAGRWISLLTGLSLLFLSISGGMMYLQLLNKCRQAGGRGLVWR